MERRQDLRVVVMSASLTDSGDFRTYFKITDDSAMISIPGRQYPVEIIVISLYVKNYTIYSMSLKKKKPKKITKRRKQNIAVIEIMRSPGIWNRL